MKSFSARLSLAYLATLACVALFANGIARELPLENTAAQWAPVPYGPNQQDKGYAPLLPPSRRHLLGTDHARRDVLARIIHGTRVALFGSLWAVGIALVLGLALGMSAGYLGGTLDFLVLRLTETLLAVPAFFLLLALLGTLSAPSLWMLLTVMGLVSWTTIARIARAETQRLRHASFVEAAKVLGYSRWRLFVRHLLPNVLPPVLVAAVFSLSSVVLTEAALSFLGFGAPETTATWGGLLQGAAGHMQAWWLVLPPGILLFLTTLAFNRLAQALRTF